MRWKSMRLPVGPYGLREIHTYPICNAHLLSVQFMGDRSTQHDQPVAVIAMSQRNSNPMWMCTATFMQTDPEAHREKARDWLLDMCLVWAKED